MSKPASALVLSTLLYAPELATAAGSAFAAYPSLSCSPLAKVSEVWHRSFRLPSCADKLLESWRRGELMPFDFVQKVP